MGYSGGSVGANAGNQPGGNHDPGKGGHQSKGPGDGGPSDARLEQIAQKVETPQPPKRDLAAEREAARLAAKRKRFATHRDKVKQAKTNTRRIRNLSDADYGQVNKSISTMKKYRDQSGAAQWDIQEVIDRPGAGLNRIAAIRKELSGDQETHDSYMQALKAQLRAKKYNMSLLQVTDPENKGRRFRGDLDSGFRFITSKL